MSFLKTLKINSVRNIEYAEFGLSPKINLIHGMNGSGKTSILEAIHLLGMGRSFRTTKSGFLTTDGQNQFSIYGETGADSKIGVSKVNRQKHLLKLDSKRQKNWDLVVRALPIQILDSNSFLLLEGGPKARRRFLDWGVFHVKRNFVDDWRASRKCIANRNALLRLGSVDPGQIRVWDSELSEAAQRVDLARKEYFDLFEPVFMEVYSSLLGEASISLSYSRGWPEGDSLDMVLSESRERDLRYGATQNGPHRADLLVKLGDQPAIDFLSRGQQKVLVSALKVAQGLVHSTAIGDPCVYLLDDLPAELDHENRDRIITKICQLECQLFVTSVDRLALEGFAENLSETRTFHVERGRIRD
jgi:DNA replication and repair protein RecF